MSDPIPAETLRHQLDADQQAALAALEAQLDSSDAREILHAKHVIKQGMEAYFTGRIHNPFPPASEDAELWTYGYKLSVDIWDDMKKPDPT